MEECIEESAYHESGHAFMAHRLGAYVHQITIEPADDDGPARYGDVMVEWKKPFASRRELVIAKIQVALAGPAAEMIYLQSPLHPAFVKEWALDWSMAEAFVAEIVKDPEQRMLLLEQTVAELFQFFDRQDIWPAIAALSDELLAHETLEWEQVEEVLGFWSRHF